MQRTYLDSGVLIAAARGGARLHREAALVAEDASREFVASDYLRLEVVPKPYYHGFTKEVAFYETYIRLSTVVVRFDENHLHAAYAEATKTGLSGFDAIHLVVAAVAGCSEFITTERRSSPIHRTRLIKTISLGSE